MRYLLLIFTVLITATAIQPVSAAQPTILVLGDSLSAGLGIAQQHSWVQLLQDRLKQAGYPHRVVNASVSGDTTRSGLSRLPHALKQHKPNIILIELGGNDGLRGLSLAELENNLRQLVTISKQAQAKVILCSVRIPPNLGPTYNSKFITTFDEIAHQENIPLVRYFLRGVADSAELMQDDGIHPNEKGQPVILENVWPTLLPLLSDSKQISNK